MVALAVLVVVLWMVWEVRRGAKLSYDTVFTAALVGIPSGVIFSRLLHVIDRWEYYASTRGRLLVVAADHLGCRSGGYPGYLDLQPVQQIYFGYFG